MPRNDFTPAHRLAPGSVLRPGGERDPVIREPRPITTGDIRLTPTAATVAGGHGYDFGKLDRKSVGMYELRYQPAPVAGGPEIGAPKYAEVEVFENSAGVFLARIRKDTADAASNTNQTDDPDVVVDGDAPAGSNAKITLAVATSTGVTNTAGTAGLKNLKVGHLFLLNAKGAGDEVVFQLTRVV